MRSNYDTLTLKLQDGLDQFERYSEQPKEAAFFKELVRRERERWWVGGQCIVGVEGVWSIKASTRFQTDPSLTPYEARLSAVEDTEL